MRRAVGAAGMVERSCVDRNLPCLETQIDGFGCIHVPFGNLLVDADDRLHALKKYFPEEGSDV